MVNVLVTNGTVKGDRLAGAIPFYRAASIGLKRFTSEWYQKLGGDLETAKRSIALAAQQCHVETTTLLVPDGNDSVGEIRALAQWLASVDPEIPLHLSHFFHGIG